MRATTLLCALAIASLTGCSADQQLRPCGPGYLGNLLVPQGFVGADFRPACRQHDRCYASNCSRKACDDQFFNDMLGACQCSRASGLCRLKAYQWYWQVRLLGGPGYQSSQRERAHCGSGCGCNCGCCDACGSTTSAGCTAGCSNCGCTQSGGGCAGGQGVATEDAPLEQFSYDADVCQTRCGSSADRGSYARSVALLSKSVSAVALIGRP
jgi:hypothetical protein